MLLLSVGCKTTKKSIDTTISSVTTEQVKSDTISSVVTTKEGLTEVITERIIETSHRSIDDLGNAITIPSTTTDRKIERFNSVTKVEKIDAISLQDLTQTSDTGESNYNRETEGQEVVKDLTQGITEGLFKSIFGKSIKHFVTGVLILIFVFILVVFRKKIRNVFSNKGEREERIS